MPLTTVYISGPGGRYATNVEAGSSHEAVRKALEFFLDPFWKGPKPKVGMIAGSNGTAMRTAFCIYTRWPVGT
jgi:hypothetical protein